MSDSSVADLEAWDHVLSCVGNAGVAVRKAQHKLERTEAVAATETLDEMLGAAFVNVSSLREEVRALPKLARHDLVSRLESLVSLATSTFLHACDFNRALNVGENAPARHRLEELERSVYELGLAVAEMAAHSDERLLN